MSICQGASPPEPGPSMKLVQLKKGAQVTGVTISRAVWGVVTHWNALAGPSGRSERCRAPRAKCTGCENELPSRWKGYIEVLPIGSEETVFVELTPAAFKYFAGLLGDREDVRGVVVKFARSKGGDNGRLSVTLGHYAGDPARLPDPRDPEPVLETLWNWQR